MKRMSSLACHFGIKLRFYPSSKQKKIIKLNYDAQRFVYNSYVGRNRTNYHARRFLASRQCQAMPFVFSALNRYETELAETVAANNELLAKPKNIRNAYSFLRVKEIDSLALAIQFKTIRRLGTTTARSDMEYRLSTRNAATGHTKPTANILSSLKLILIMELLSLSMTNTLNCLSRALSALLVLEN